MSKAARMTPRRPRITDTPAAPAPPAPPAPPDPAGESASTEPAEDVERFTLPRDPKTGFLRWDRMRGETKDKFLKLMADPAVAQQAGTGTDGQTDAELNAFVVNVLYDAIGVIGSVIAQTRGFSQAAARAMLFSPAEKNALAAPTIRVLNKYNLMNSQYQDEILLLLAAGGIIGGKIKQMSAIDAAPIMAAPQQPPLATAPEPSPAETLAAVS